MGGERDAFEGLGWNRHSHPAAQIGDRILARKLRRPPRPQGVCGGRSSAADL
jgi:hypothetical protein